MGTLKTVLITLLVVFLFFFFVVPFIYKAMSGEYPPGFPLRAVEEKQKMQQKIEGLEAEKGKLAAEIEAMKKSAAKDDGQTADGKNNGNLIDRGEKAGENVEIIGSEIE